MVGLRQQATSDGFTVDATAPVSGRVVIVSPSPSNFDIQQISARYGNFPFLMYKTHLLHCHT
jgi:hypothetical protein